MDLGILIPTRGAIATPKSMVDLVRYADDKGLKDIWVGDHIVLFEELDENTSKYPMTSSGRYLGAGGEDMYECLTMLTYFGAITKNVRIGTNVFIVPTHNPVLTAKALSSLDVMTGGRVVLGAAVGWMKEEFEVMRADFETRGAVTTEYVKLMKHLWTVERPEWNGKHYQVKKGMQFHPKPARKEGIPVWFGTTSKIATKRAAEIGDGINMAAVSPKELGEHASYLKEQLEIAGRPKDACTVSARLAFDISDKKQHKDIPCRGSIAKIVDDLGKYKEIGLQHIILAPRRHFDGPQFMDQIEQIRTDIMPKI